MRTDNSTVGMYFDATPSKQHVKNVTKGIVKILQAGFENHSDQQTIQVAINALTNLSKIENTSVSHCNISMNNNGDEKDEGYRINWS